MKNIQTKMDNSIIDMKTIISKINKSLFLRTDFYQISMAYAYIMLDMANTKTGYEGFIRHIKPEINPDKNYMIFDGKNEVVEYIESIKQSIKDGTLVEQFIIMLEGKVNKIGWKEEFREKFSKLDTDFEYSVVDNGTIVFPYIPVFQFYGPSWIGQMIETYATNIYNGKTGIRTLKEMKKIGKKDISDIDIDYIESIVNGVPSKYFERYTEDLHEVAKNFKQVSNNKIVLEAGFRRAPGFEAAKIASSIAIKEGWNGTSNTSLFGEIQDDKIGGTMAHAFVMSFETEIEAFRDWASVFPKSTMLIDTYDTIGAVKKLIMNKEDYSDFDPKSIMSSKERDDSLKPKEVRIDSGDFFTIVQEVRDIFDSVGWNDVGIFISGDMSVDVVQKLTEKNVPFDKYMAGTKYVYNNSIIKQCNSGFVYKIVQYEKNGKKFYPEKKSENKSNYPGMKFIEDKGDNSFVVYTNTSKEMDISATKNFDIDSMIIFDYNQSS